MSMTQAWRVLAAVTFAFTVAGAGVATTAAADEDVWAPLRPLVGRWEGTSRGEPGEGRSERTCEFILGGKFLQCRNKGTYPPQEKNAKGEVHEDVGIFSYDKARKTFVLRQFHVEGFVNQYVLDPAAASGGTVTFTTESVENIAPGWRARESYRFPNPDEWLETFSLAAPAKPFETYSEGRFHRVK